MSTKGPLGKARASRRGHQVLGQNRSHEEGPKKYGVPRKFSNHVLGQNRFLGQGSFDKIATQEIPNHALGQNRFLEEGGRNIFRDTELFKSCPWSKSLPWRRGQGADFALLGSKAPTGNVPDADVPSVSQWQHFA